ncbi:LmrA/YxaF family transcription factor [Peribacillus butanolivorans]|uniref:LmrA/YxaF family transcription factor n=1 Tax=Peribacillus butanolivorans TaxID=421767 RepID=UPI0036C77C7C
MATLSDPVRKAGAELYAKIQGIYFKKLMEDGYSKELASNIALMITASIEGQ